MTIGDEQVVAEIGPVYMLLWAGTDSVASIVNAHGLRVGDRLIPRSAYAELAAERDKLAALRKHHRARAKSYKRRATDAESQLAELRGRVSVMLEKWSADSGKHPGTIESIVMKAICAELSTLAAADGATTGEMKCPTP